MNDEFIDPREYAAARFNVDADQVTLMSFYRNTPNTSGLCSVDVIALPGCFYVSWATDRASVDSEKLISNARAEQYLGNIS